MLDWLPAALDYLPRWLDYQARQVDQPGYVLAIAEGDALKLEHAYGVADLVTGEALTPRHLFRVASHSKTFTAAGIMRLREQGRLTLDDPAVKHVAGLTGSLAQATIGQLLSHSSGSTRDGADASHWLERKPFPPADDLRATLASAQPLEPNARFKYSNIAFGLLGLVIEAITGETYIDWTAREVVAAAGLRSTLPDLLGEPPSAMASGHGTKQPLGRRVPLPARYATNALAAATGFTSTAADLVAFFSQLDPGAKTSFLSRASRLEMSRAQWRNPHSDQERYYGLGTMVGWDHGRHWFGHGGAFPGFITRTTVLTDFNLAISILTNAIDGQANQWMDGAVQIVRHFANHGAPRGPGADWTGRWWSLWTAQDLVPMGDRVLIANPALAQPLTDAPELTIHDATHGVISLANGYGSHGEPVRRVLDGGRASEVWLGGSRLVPEAEHAEALRKRLG